MILILQIIQYLLNRYFNLKLKKLIFGNGGKKEFTIGTFWKKKNFYKYNGLLLVNDFKSNIFF